MPQHQYLALFVYIITVYTSLYYILKHKISKRNNIYVCDGKHRPEHFLFIHKTKFHNNKFYSQPASFVPNVVPCLGSSSRFKTHRLCIISFINQSLNFTVYLKETDNQSNIISILLKEPFALKNSETVYFTSIFSTPSYSDIAPIDNFDLTFFYFYFVFEVFDTIQF